MDEVEATLGGLEILSQGAGATLDREAGAGQMRVPCMEGEAGVLERAWSALSAPQFTHLLVHSSLSVCKEPCMHTLLSCIRMPSWLPGCRTGAATCPGVGAFLGAEGILSGAGVTWADLVVGRAGKGGDSGEDTMNGLPSQKLTLHCSRDAGPAMQPSSSSRSPKCRSCNPCAAASIV